MFFKSLLHVPSPATPLSRFTLYSGLFYLGFGLTTYAFPAVVQLTLPVPPFSGHEEGMMRLIGFTLVVIGFFYIAGSRTRAESFGLATVLDRLLVPLFLVPLGLTHAVEPPIAYLFAVLDPVLGIAAYVIWRRSQRS